MLIGEKVASLNEIGWYSGTESSLRNTGSRLAFANKQNLVSTSFSEQLLAVPGFQCAHHSGVHAVFCDGQTRRLSRKIDLVILQRLANRHDGEFIDNF